MCHGGCQELGAENGELLIMHKFQFYKININVDGRYNSMNVFSTTELNSYNQDGTFYVYFTQL